MAASLGLAAFASRFWVPRPRLCVAVSAYTNWLTRAANAAFPGSIIRHYLFPNLVKLETVEHEMDYIHRNPVKRGLRSRPEDWHWSSAADYAGVRAGPMGLNRESLPRLSEAMRDRLGLQS